MYTSRRVRLSGSMRFQIRSDVYLTYIHAYIERPSADAADPEHVTPPRPTPGDVGWARNQPRNHSIVQAHSVRTIGVLGQVAKAVDADNTSVSALRMCIYH